jgi:hypothetical protein
MTNNKLYKLFSILFSLTILLGCGNSDTSPGLLIKPLEAEHRTPSYVERDKYRHPKETLLFFGLNPGTVCCRNYSGIWLVYRDFSSPDA